MAFGQICRVLEMEPLPSNKQPLKFPWADKEGGSLLSVLPQLLEEACRRCWLFLRLTAAGWQRLKLRSNVSEVLAQKQSCFS